MTYRCDFDLPTQQVTLDALREKTQNPNFWANQDTAKTIMRDVARIEREIKTWQSLEESLDENRELIFDSIKFHIEFLMWWIFH